MHNNWETAYVNFHAASELPCWILNPDNVAFNLPILLFYSVTR